jgi:acetyl-CoA carboxylase carboxyl transferase subunit beta
MGYVDGILQEPALGVRCYHYDFLHHLRQEVLRVTDEIVLEVRGIEPFRSMARRSRRKKTRVGLNMDTVHLRWELSSSAQDRLVERRHKKFRKLSAKARIDPRTTRTLLIKRLSDFWWEFSSYIRYDLFRRRQQKISNFFGEIQSETSFFLKHQTAPVRSLFRKLLPRFGSKNSGEAEKQLTTLSDWSETENRQKKWTYISDKAKEDRAVVCPNAPTHGCLDMWAPDLYGEFAGVCTHCGHHFPMEYQWYMYNIFDKGSIREFNSGIEAANPLDYEGFDVKLEKAKSSTALKSSCITFEADINQINLVVAMLVAPFRGGSVGAAEGEKFILASELASKKRLPFLAYVHGTAGIRIQEGVNGVIQMPRCTMAVRRYIDAGGLYLVLYDTSSYAGPVASFLGCSPYQFAIRSSNVGFAGPGVILETTGIVAAPNYHSAYKALARGHIQGIWDRREVRFNLQQSMLTMGGRNLYYK